jgi:hypothetical protein
VKFIKTSVLMFGDYNDGNVGLSLSGEIQSLLNYIDYAPRYCFYNLFNGINYYLAGEMNLYFSAITL